MAEFEGLAPRRIVTLSAGTKNQSEALQRFRSNIGLQGAEVRVRLNRRTVGETGCCEVRGRSRDLWLSDMVMVQGFSWCADQPKEITIATLVAKILCRKHNSDLSPVDASAGQSFDSLREVARLKNVRGGMTPIRWNVKKYQLDGTMLERWLLKTLINIAFDGKYAIGSDAMVAGRLSERLVRIAYGIESFKGKAGLYTMSRVGMDIAMEDRVSFSPIMQRAPHGEYVVAGIFIFRGFQFLLYLEPEGPQDLTGIYFKGQHLKGTGLMFQTLTANIKIGKYLSHAVKIVRKP